jgi:phage head maturation protease
MTKKEMIQIIQKQEAALFLNAKHVELLVGEHDTMYQRAINKWLGVNAMMDALGIMSDYTLPDAQESAELISQINKKQA